MMPRFSIATNSLNMPIRAALKAVGLMPEVRGVRLETSSELRPREFTQTAKRELLHYLKELDLQLTGLQFPVRQAFYDPQDLDARLAATREAMGMAALLQARHFCFKIGQIPADPASKEYQMLLETISDLARHGNHIGVILTIIPLGETAETLEQFLSQIRSGPIAIDFDPSRWVLTGQKPVPALRSLYRYVEQFTARDAVRDFTGGGEETDLGRGEVVWDELLATLDEIDYRSWITLQRSRGDNRSAELQRSAGYLQNIMHEI